LFMQLGSTLSLIMAAGHGVNACSMLQSPKPIKIDTQVRAENDPVSEIQELPHNKPKSEMYIEEENPTEKKKKPLLSPDGTTSVTISPEEAKDALIRWAKIERVDLRESMSFIRETMEYIQKRFNKGELFPEYKGRGKWDYRETKKSITARYSKNDNSIEPKKEMSWHYDTIIEGWKCELVHCSAWFQIANTNVLGHFEKDCNGKWIVVVDHEEHHTPHGL